MPINQLSSKVPAFSFIILILLSSRIVFGQAITGFAPENSDILQKLADKKSENPKIKPAELAVFGNQLIDEQGLNYQFELAANICEQVAARRAKLKPNQSNEVGGKFALQPKDGDTTNLFIKNIETLSCGICYATMPVVAADDKEVIVLIKKQNTGFLRTDSLFLNDVALLDNQTTSKVTRQWTIPSRLVPLGVSADGTSLYLPVPAAKLDELALIVYETGVINFVARADVDLSEKPIEVKVNDPTIRAVAFGTGGKKRILRFNAPCN